VQLSLDLELQKKSYELIKDKRAAVIVTNPKTGEILASVSSPGFNSQDFEDQVNPNIQKYFTDGSKPLFNRVAEGIYPPGSLFKLVIATAGLEGKAIDEKTQIEDTGILKAGPLNFGNWYFLQYGKTEGMVNIVKAIKRSNDIFFYKVGEKTGVDNIKKWADIFGLGRRTGIGVDEAEGMIPSTFWKKEVLKENWYLGDTYNLSIGQGYVGTTPLQIVLATGIFANGGNLCIPKLLKAQTSPDLSLQKYVQTECRKLPISNKTISLIREGMKEACSTGGTGWPLFDFKTKNGPVQTACKTGTAEIQAKSGLPDAWITVFAPFNNPEIALTVLVEEGGEGSNVAGPIAKEILKAYFERSQ
jgi:penicillin-binding protein 2